eukprot:TRINITY_DN5094_c0_g1_i1.p1 TRINITY_DN5094_c0_g1~~TRINITY_DN5094_c0_g1_i1.p1  ORF type:complete len:601 (+),score=138.66 TRINITY_DN5094_c0_g1_i1:211-1803(+)
MKREWKEFNAEIKENPLGPIKHYWNRFVLKGMGLYVGAYVLFSIGTLKILFQESFPDCWKNFNVCNRVLVQSTEYLQIVGIIFGQIVVGIEGDVISKRFGFIQNALVMLLGVLMLTASWGTSLQGWVIMYTIAQLIFGFGVGGEYPLTSGSSMEESSSSNAGPLDRMHRGRSTVLVFTMQGWAQLSQQLVLILLLLMFNKGGNPPYSEVAAQGTFRVGFFIVGVAILWLVYHRAFKMKPTTNVSQSKEKKSASAYNLRSLQLVLKYYWHRLIGTAIVWYCNDFFFYGNKIFQADFIRILSPTSGDNVMTNWLYNLLNIGIAMIGYYAAAFTIDWPIIGRKRMQATGLLANFIISIIIAAAYDPLTTPQGLGILQFLYFFSSFWGQFGSNCTTFLIAAEVYPSAVRGTAHGFSAATGKMGALTASVLYNYIPDRTKFWVVCWMGLLGFLLTVVFVPDATALDLREQERRWNLTVKGRDQDYHGLAVHPRHLSWFERVVLKVDKQYDLELDHQQRLEEKEQARKSNDEEITL